jgi:hypothetical protein
MKVTLTIVPDPIDPTGLQGVVWTIRCAADAGLSGVWFPQPPPGATLTKGEAVSNQAGST